MFHERHVIGAMAIALAAVCTAILPVQAASLSGVPSSAMSEADTLVLQPGSEGVDTYVFSWQTRVNFGTDAWFHAIGLPSSEALLQFDVSSIPPGSTILSAQIALWGEFRAGTLTFAPIASTWNESTVIWDTKPGTTLPTVTQPMDTCSFGCTKSFEITDVVRYAVDHPASNFGMKVTGNTPGIGWMVASSDNPTPGYRPKLTVFWVPGGVPVAPGCWGSIKSIYR